MRSALGENDMMAYLAMMSVRLIELHRVLKPTGSLYLHCDPTASHYLKTLLDAIFDPHHYVNEIIWKRYGAHNDVGQGSQHYGRVHDTILFYSKSEERHWTQLFVPLDADYINETYRLIDEKTGRRFTTTPLTGPGGAEKGNPVFEWNGHERGGTAKKQYSGFMMKVNCIIQRQDTPAKNYSWRIPEACPFNQSGQIFHHYRVRTKNAWATKHKSPLRFLSVLSPRPHMKVISSSTHFVAVAPPFTLHKNLAANGSAST